MPPKLSMLAAALSVCVITQAQAGFYVSDDAPIIATAHSETTRKHKTVFAEFTRQRIASTSRAELVAAVDALPAIDTITLTTFTRSSRQLAAANRRLATVRAILIREGVPSSKITSSAEIDPEADPLDTSVQVAFRAATQRTAVDALRAARYTQTATVPPAPQIAPAASVPRYATPVIPQPSPSADATAVTGASQSQTAKLEFVKKIMAMAASKLISQESAIKLTNEYLANMAPVAGQPPAALPQSAVPIVATAPQIVPFGEAPRVWTLAANKSLRDNIREWAAAAGYGELKWTASDPYQVTYTSTYTGTFLEVLHQVANVIPAVDFRVSPAARRLEVVDHAPG